MNLLLTAAFAVHLLAPPSAMPVQYTATNPQGASLTYDPARGWVGTGDCPWGCYVAADQAVPLLQGEIELETLAALDVTVRRDGVPVAQFYRFFGGVAVYDLPH